MSALRIFFGDLTHNTIGLATEVFPLNVGYIASYCKKIHGDAVDIQIFKYPAALERAILDYPPDVLALSNYPWCHRLGLAMFELLSEVSPRSIRVMGGPNFPHAGQDQTVFLRHRPLIDHHIHLDGEVPFAELVGHILRLGLSNETRMGLRAERIDSVCHLDGDGRLVSGSGNSRLLQLDDIPSPYLTGLLDPFFDGQLSPMIQTNRGCPFKCSFCHDGTDLVNKVTQFSVDRVRAELNYIAARVPKNTHSLFISDLNFGMFKRDAEICDTLAELTRTRGYPAYIDTTTGKNSKKRIISAIEKLEGVLGLTMSVQSMSDTVLKNIKRDNISIADFTDLMPSIKAAKLPTVSEVILGLPGETKASHLLGIRRLLDTQVDHLTPYTLMLVNGSELATPAAREKWGFVTKYRVIPRDFTAMSNGKFVVELEEVVVAHHDMSFSDYVDCRKIALLIVLTNNAGLRALLKLLRESGFGPMDLIEAMDQQLNAADVPWSRLRELAESFAAETIGELWESEGEAAAFFSKAENFEGLVEGRFGANLMQTYRARAFATCFDQVVDLAIACARSLIGQERISGEEARAFEDVRVYCRGLIHNLFGGNRAEDVPSAALAYDVPSWVADADGRHIAAFRFDAPQHARFVLSPRQIEVVNDGLKLFGDNDLGRGKMLIRINTNMLWRRCELVTSGSLPNAFGLYAISESAVRYGS
jgi:radical SAM superfamily enzyme YgiQ (UPF0313 family)